MPDVVYEPPPEELSVPDPDAQMEAWRIPPHSVQAEQAVLGGLMLDNGAWDKVADQVTEQDFYRREHQLVFSAIGRLAEADRPFDVVTLAEELEGLESIDEVGGLAYLGMLANETPSAANIQAYAAIVREQSVVRQLIKVGNQIAESGFRPKGRKVHELLDYAENQVFQIAEQQARGGGGFRSITRLLTETINRIEELYGSEDALTGVSSGFSDFDAKTSGLQKADLIIVAGRPSMGKTTFAMNIAENVAVSNDLPVAIFSMEMPGEALTMRMISSLGRVNQQAVRSGKLEDDDWPRVTSAVNIL